MFYFDSNTTASLKCAVLVFWGDSVCLQNVVWLTVPWDPNKISDAYKTNDVIASRSMNAFRYFNDAR